MMSPAEIYDHFKNKKDKYYDEKAHCQLLIEVMLNPNKGTVPAFCVIARIAEVTFWEWVRKHQIFSDIYSFSKMIARELWEEEGRRIRDSEFPLGTVNYSFEHWKMMGISKNSRIKVEVNENAEPKDLYKAILKQAQSGDFTAAEFKQLMESVNVGVNIHKLFDLQRQVDELTENLKIMSKNQNGHNPVTN
jgi:hypothetical protein